MWIYDVLLPMKIRILILIFVFSFTKLFADNIPVIVIAPGKSVQSYSTVGSSVSVLDKETLENLFPLKYYGHYSRLGYKKVADSILLNLKKRTN